MDIIRRNTDYALRTMLHLAAQWRNEPVAAIKLAQNQLIPYQLACKLLQKLQKHKLVKSSMGPKGGYSLNKKPSRINLLDIIEIFQGPLCLNRCMLDIKKCPLGKNCLVSKKLSVIQKYMKNSLASISLAELLQKSKTNKRKRKNKAINII